MGKKKEIKLQSPDWCQTNREFFAVIVAGVGDAYDRKVLTIQNELFFVPVLDDLR